MLELDVRLPGIGNIKMGAKVQHPESGKWYPQQWNHFKITKMDKDENDNWIIDTDMTAKVAHEKCDPQKPTAVGPLYLPMDSVDGNLYRTYGRYTRSKVLCTGDGSKAEERQENGETKWVDCDPDTCEHYLKGDCSLSCVLSCMFEQQSTLGGVYLFRSHGSNSVRGLYSQLRFYQEQTTRMFGRPVLSGIPYWLVVRHKRQSDRDGRMREIRFASLEFEGTITSLQDFCIEKIRVEAASRNTVGYSAGVPKLNGAELEENAREVLMDAEEWGAIEMPEDESDVQDADPKNPEPKEEQKPKKTESKKKEKPEPEKGGEKSVEKTEDTEKKTDISGAMSGKKWNIPQDMAADICSLLDKKLERFGRKDVEKQLGFYDVGLENLNEISEENAAQLYKRLQRVAATAEPEPVDVEAQREAAHKALVSHIGQVVKEYVELISPDAGDAEREADGYFFINKHAPKKIEQVKDLRDLDMESLLALEVKVTKALEDKKKSIKEKKEKEPELDDLKDEEDGPEEASEKLW